MHKQKFDVRRKILAENGIEVDRIIKRDGNQVIINLIEQGLATERYESWKNHPSKHVREALAKQGYYPDLYINDKSPDVRKHIIYQYPKQSLKRMHNHNDRFAIRWELVRTNPNLTDWHKQGVFLLNTALTVPEKEPNAHKKLWKRFTDDLLVYLTQVNPDILYVMWGGNAKEHGQRIEQELNCNDNILYSSHPSPLSARHSFFGSKPFSWVNYQLRCQRKAPIDWT